MILGDSAYPCSKHLVAVYKDDQQATAATARRRRRFNKLVSSTRIVVEQSIGTLKMRFPVLQQTMRVKATNASKIMLACAAIHNFLINTGAGVLDNDEFDQVIEEDSNLGR